MQLLLLVFLFFMISHWDVPNQSYGILLDPFDFFYNPCKYHMIGTIYRPHVLRCYICNVSNNGLQLTEVGVQIIGKEGIDLNQKLKWL